MIHKNKYHVWKNYFSMLFKAKLPWTLLVVCFLLSLAAAQISLTFAKEIGIVVAWQEEISLVIPKLWLLLLLGVLNLICIVGGAHLKGIAIAQIDRNVQRYAVNKIFNANVDQIEEKDTRELITRLTDDTTKNSTFLIEIFVNEIPRIYYIVAALITILKYNQPFLVWTLLLSIPVTIIFSFISGRITFKNREKIQSKLSILTSKLAEKIENIEVIKSYNNEQNEIASGNSVLDEYDKVKKEGVTVDKVNVLMKHLTWLSQFCLIVAPPAILKFKNVIDISTFISYLMIAATFITYVREHLDVWVYLKEAQGATLRLSYIISLEETVSKDKTINLGNIEFSNVSFAYGENQVLNDVSFVIEKGKKTALVGLSGSGKSTILNLIEKFYLPSKGEITLSGKNIDLFDTKEYRKNFAYLPQNAPGISGSVRDMLNFSCDKPFSDEELIDVLKKVDLFDYLSSLGGLDYDIGFNGENLSGGQKQKLGIARLLLSNCEYVLLDEATSALDIKATNLVTSLLDEKYQGRTQIIVSHDLQTVTNADNIIVFEDGKVVASGKHDELLNNSEYYCQLVNGGK